MLRIIVKTSNVLCSTEISSINSLHELCDMRSACKNFIQRLRHDPLVGVLWIWAS